MRVFIATLAAMALTGCIQGPDKVTIQTQYVPIPTPCAVSAGPEPTFADTDFAIAATPKGDILTLAKLYAAGRQQRIAYIAALEAANAGCSPKP